MSSVQAEGRNRNSTIDTIKAAAIILVVFGHCIQYGSGQDFFARGAYFEDFLFRLIYSFHMPLFMLISGYLFALSIEKYSWREIIRRKMLTLAVPILSWSSIEWLNEFLHVIKDREPFQPASMLLTYLKYVFFGPWFLWALLLCSLAVLLVHHVFCDNPAVYFLLFVLSFLIVDRICPAIYKLCIHILFFRIWAVGIGSIFLKSVPLRFYPVAIPYWGLVCCLQCCFLSFAGKATFIQLVSAS